MFENMDCLRFVDCLKDSRMQKRIRRKQKLRDFFPREGLLNAFEQWAELVLGFTLTYL